MPHTMPDIQSPSDHPQDKTSLSPLWKNAVKRDGGTVTLASGVPPVLFVSELLPLASMVAPVQCWFRNLVLLYMLENYY